MARMMRKNFRLGVRFWPSHDLYMETRTPGRSGEKIEWQKQAEEEQQEKDEDNEN